jgi:hypothetical protein
MPYCAAVSIALLDTDLIYVQLPPTDTDAVVTQRSARRDLH